MRGQVDEGVEPSAAASQATHSHSFAGNRLPWRLIAHIATKRMVALPGRAKRCAARAAARKASAARSVLASLRTPWAVTCLPVTIVSVWGRRQLQGELSIMSQEATPEVEAPAGEVPAGGKTFEERIAELKKPGIFLEPVHET